MNRLADETLEWLGEMFVNNNILDKHGVTFAVFINEWELGLLDKYNLKL